MLSNMRSPSQFVQGIERLKQRHRTEVEELESAEKLVQRYEEKKLKCEEDYDKECRLGTRNLCRANIRMKSSFSLSSTKHVF